MNRSTLSLVVFILMLALVPSCSKKNKGTAAGANPPPPPAQPLPPPPIHVDDPTIVHGATWQYCGSTNDNLVGPQLGQTYFDVEANLYWFMVNGYATFWSLGQWHWYAPSCQQLYTWYHSHTGYEYYYDFFPQPQPCYTCYCTTCDSYFPPHAGPTPTPTPTPGPTPNPNPSCGGSTRSLSTIQVDMNVTLDSGRNSVGRWVSVGETQDYYLLFKARYTGVGPGGAQRNSETARILLDNQVISNVPDLNTSSTNNTLDNIFSEQCYVRVCLQQGRNDLYFRGTGDSLVMTGFEISTSRPNASRCN